MLDIQAVSYFAAGICIGAGAIGAAVGEGYAAGMANQALSSNPKESGNILKTMLVGQAIAESAGIFALVVAMLLIFVPTSKGGLSGAAAMLGAGLAMGFSAVGSGVGSGFPAGAACRSIGAQPKLSGPLTTNMLNRLGHLSDPHHLRSGGGLHAHVSEPGPLVLAHRPGGPAGRGAGHGPGRHRLRSGGGHARRGVLRRDRPPAGGLHPS